MDDPAQESFRPRAVFLIVIVFALGLIAGAATWFLAGKVFAHHLWGGRGGPGGPPLEHLTRELKLDPEQRRQVEAIFERHRARFHEIISEQLISSYIQLHAAAKTQAGQGFWKLRSSAFLSDTP